MPREDRIAGDLPYGSVRALEDGGNIISGRGMIQDEGCRQRTANRSRTSKLPTAPAGPVRVPPRLDDIVEPDIVGDASGGEVGIEQGDGVPAKLRPDAQCSRCRGLPFALSTSRLPRSSCRPPSMFSVRAIANDQPPLGTKAERADTGRIHIHHCPIGDHEILGPWRFACWM